MMTDRKKPWKQISCLLIFLLAGFIGGGLGTLLGVAFARKLLHQTEVIVNGIWVAALGGGIGGALGMWVGWQQLLASKLRQDTDR